MSVSSLRSFIGVVIVYSFVTTYRQLFFNCNNRVALIDPSNGGADNMLNKNNFVVKKKKEKDAVSLVQNLTTAAFEYSAIPKNKKNEHKNDNNDNNEQATSSRRITGGNIDNNDNDSDSFSACILVNDENHRLPEWLAYHYYALNLKYVVVAVDPHSTTSPTPIFDKWRASNRMQIVEWSDHDFAVDGENYSIGKAKTEREKEQTHRHRQRDFYRACIQHLQSHNRTTWTSFHDVDEYLTINRDLYGDGENDSSKISIKQPGSVLKLIEKYSDSNNNGNNIKVKPWYEHFQKTPCVTLGRILYSAKEEEQDEKAPSQLKLPPFIDPHRFDTLRYVHRASLDDKKHNGRSKSIIDLSRVDKHLKGWTNPHQPLTSICKDEWTQFASQPMGFHHYLGSFESYSFRKDARATKSHGKQAWEERSMLDDNAVHDDIRPWINGFIDLVGESDAKYLLEGAGVLFGSSGGGGNTSGGNGIKNKANLMNSL